MKRTLLIITLLILATAIMAVPVVGLNSTTSVKLGNDKQDASNPEAQDVEDRIVRLTGSMEISNVFGTELQNLSSSVTPNGFSLTDLNFSFASTGANAFPSSLAANSKKTVGFSVNVPGGLDAVDAQRLRESAFKVADITVSGTAIGENESTTVTALEMQRENKLEVDKVIVCVNDRCKSVDDGDDVEDIKPGDRMSIEVVVENTYSDSDREDVDFDDVEIEYEIDDNDFNEDDSESIGDLGADDEDSETFSFDVEDDVDDGNYDLVVRVFGDDENGAFHGEEINIDLRVEREDHDIEIRGAILNPSKLTCGADTTRANINFANIGKRDEDEVLVEVIIDEFGIRERIGPFELDEDDTRSESVAITLPENADPKTYNVIVKSLYDGSVPSDERIIELEVEGCTAEDVTESTTVDNTQQTTTTQQQPVVQQQRPPTASQRRTPATTTTTDSDSFTDSGWYIALLAIIAVVVLGVLIVLVVKALGRSSEEL